MGQNNEPTPEQRQAVRNEMKESFEHLRKRSGRTLLGTFIDHLQSPEGKPLRDFGEMVDQASGGLLSKAIKGIMTPDEPTVKKASSDITIKEVKKH